LQDYRKKGQYSRICEKHHFAYDTYQTGTIELTFKWQKPRIWRLIFICWRQPDVLRQAQDERKRRRLACHTKPWRSMAPVNRHVQEWWSEYNH